MRTLNPLHNHHTFYLSCGLFAVPHSQRQRSLGIPYDRLFSGYDCKISGTHLCTFRTIFFKTIAMKLGKLIWWYSGSSVKPIEVT